MSVNKSQLIEKIAKDAEISKVNASAVVQALITELTKALKKDGKVTLQGFGTFT
jgi:DNA-binding protein HU-beta